MTKYKATYFRFVLNEGRHRRTSNDLSSRCNDLRGTPSVLDDDRFLLVDLRTICRRFQANEIFKVAFDRRDSGSNSFEVSGRKELEVTNPSSYSKVSVSPVVIWSGHEAASDLQQLVLRETGLATTNQDNKRPTYQVAKKAV